MKSFAALLLLSSIAVAGERPASAPPVDERLTGIEARMKTLETRVNLVERDVDRLTGKTSTTPGYEIQRGPEVEATPNCPCFKGGKCICGNDCQCPLCLEHLTNVEVVSLYAAHEAEISKIWEGLGDKEDATMKAAVIVWIKQQHCKHQGVEALPLTGKRALVFTATWCGPCKSAAKTREECGLVEGVDYELIDLDAWPDLKAKYNVDQIPFLILLDGNETKQRYLGPTFQAEKIKAWIESGQLIECEAVNGKVTTRAAGSRPMSTGASLPAMRSQPVMIRQSSGFTYQCGPNGCRMVPSYCPNCR
jgi:hypothetical protein